jgi:hypothetical protein
MKRAASSSPDRSGINILATKNFKTADQHASSHGTTNATSVPQFAPVPDFTNPYGLIISDWRAFHRISTNSQRNTVEYFISQTKIVHTTEDPAEASGLNQAIKPLSDNYARQFSDRQVAEIEQALQEKIYKATTERHYSVGHIVGNRWPVKQKLSGVSGSFNKGILLYKILLTRTTTITS